MTDTVKPRKPIATRKNPNLRKLLGHLGTHGCQVRHIRDEHEARQIVCALFNVPNVRSLADLLEAIQLLGDKERQQRACRNIQEKVPEPTLLWPADAKVRLRRSTEKRVARKPGASAAIAAHRAAVTQARPLPQGGTAVGVVDQRKALAAEARKLLRRDRTRMERRH